MRNIPDELVKRYEREGWWTPDTLGDLLARGLAAAPGTEFRVHSDVRPYTGTFADVELTARRLAAGLASAASARATWWRSSCRTGSRRRRRSRPSRTSARSSCRSCTSTAARRSATSCADAGRRSSPPTASAHLDFFANLDALRADLPDRSRWSWSWATTASWRRSPLRRPARRRARSTARWPIDPDAPALVAYTSGTTARPEGRRALAPHASARDPPARRRAEPQGHRPAARSARRSATGSGCSPRC